MEWGIAGGSTFSFGPLSIGFGSPPRSKRALARVALTALDMSACNLSMKEITEGNIVVSTHSFTFDNVPAACMRAIELYEMSPGLIELEPKDGVYRSLGQNSAFIQPATHTGFMQELHAYAELTPEKIARILMGLNGGEGDFTNLTITKSPDFESLLK